MAGVFIAQNNFESLPNPTYKQCRDFLEFLRHPEFATEVIFGKHVVEILVSRILVFNFEQNLPIKEKKKANEASTE